jgi:hypothetical protein
MANQYIVYFIAKYNFEVLRYKAKVGIYIIFD